MLVALVAFVSIWAAMGIMLAWSLVATLAYCQAREHGLPDLVTVQRPRTSGGVSCFLRHAAGSAVKVWFVGLHNLVFARLAGGVLCDGSTPFAKRRRFAVLSLGMTLFGVTTAEHLLRRAGLSGKPLLRRSLIGPFLNVPYRIFLSAAVMHGVLQLMDSVCDLQGCLPYA